MESILRELPAPDQNTQDEVDYNLSSLISPTNSTEKELMERPDDRI